MQQFYDCFKLHDVTMTLILGHAFTSASNKYQTVSFLIPRGHFRETMTFGQLASAAKLFAELHAGTKNSYRKPPLL